VKVIRYAGSWARRVAFSSARAASLDSEGTRSVKRGTEPASEEFDWYRREAAKILVLGQRGLIDED
jgi:hypothetical protein